jgi:NAD(P)-dependent dehydrogenase (short-subunit alcohol dehydrogenase family)
MLFQDKVAIVTGGGSGIGRATALALAQAGAAVVIGNRNADQGEAVVREIASSGERARFLRTDVSKVQDVRALVDCAVSTFGHLDLAFNNAGMDGEQKPIHEQDDERVRELFNVNVAGTYFAMKYEALAMLQSGGGGAIVNCGSVFGIGGYPGWSAYAASKHAITGMTKTAALDYAKQGIRVNAVAPGPIETPLLAKSAGGNPHLYASVVPMGRIGRPEEVANAVVWLLSDAASFVTGHVLVIDGGFAAQ